MFSVSWCVLRNHGKTCAQNRRTWHHTPSRETGRNIVNQPCKFLSGNVFTQHEPSSACRGPSVCWSAPERLTTRAQSTGEIDLRTECGTDPEFNFKRDTSDSCRKGRTNEHVIRRFLFPNEIKTYEAGNLSKMRQKWNNSRVDLWIWGINQ